MFSFNTLKHNHKVKQLTQAPLPYKHLDQRKVTFQWTE